jgi:hypothetical protein
MTNPAHNTLDCEPITLKEACELYPRSRFTVSTLRAEASRGRLDIFRIGKRDYTTPAAMREMVRKCQDAARLRASTSTQDESSGLSETERASSAQAALSQTVVALKAGLPRTSGNTTNQRAAQRR